MITIRMQDNPDSRYGNVARSVDRFYIRGRGVHNPEFPHELIKWDFAGTRSEGKETDGLKFTARATVIAAPATGCDHATTHELCIGDRVEVYGQAYVVIARPLNDPGLAPVPAE